jgi:hypothetical protein
VKRFRAISQDSIALDPDVMSSIGMRLFTSGERRYLEHESGRIGEFSGDTAGTVTSWTLLRDLYGANAIVSLTGIGFNDAEDQALARVR